MKVLGEKILIETLGRIASYSGGRKIGVRGGTRVKSEGTPDKPGRVCVTGAGVCKRYRKYFLRH